MKIILLEKIIVNHWNTIRIYTLYGEETEKSKNKLTAAINKLVEQEKSEILQTT